MFSIIFLRYSFGVSSFSHLAVEYGLPWQHQSRHIPQRYRQRRHEITQRPLSLLTHHASGLVPLQVSSVCYHEAIKIHALQYRRDVPLPQISRLYIINHMSLVFPNIPSSLGSLPFFSLVWGYDLSALVQIQIHI